MSGKFLDESLVPPELKEAFGGGPNAVSALETTIADLLADACRRPLRKVQPFHAAMLNGTILHVWLAKSRTVFDVYFDADLTRVESIRILRLA